MPPLYRAGQRDLCTVRSQPVSMANLSFFFDSAIIAIENPLNVISWEPLELGFWYLAYGLESIFRWPEYFWADSVKYWLSYVRFQFYHESNRKALSTRYPLELGVWYLACDLGSVFRWLGINVKMTWILLSRFREILTKLCPFSILPWKQ